MIKKLNLKYECQSCGSILSISRLIIFDEYLKKIDIVKPIRCSCGEKSKFLLLDLNIENESHD